MHFEWISLSFLPNSAFIPKKKMKTKENKRRIRVNTLKTALKFKLIFHGSKNSIPLRELGVRIEYLTKGNLM